MSRQRDDVFRRVIKYAEMPATPVDFTASVMQEITAGQQETVMNPVLGKLLKQHGVEQAPADFKNRVMSQLVQTENRAVYQPVISKKTGFAIAAIITLAICLLSLNGEKHTYSATGDTYDTIISSMHHIPSVYILTLFIACTLLLADYIFGHFNKELKLKSARH